MRAPLNCIAVHKKGNPLGDLRLQCMELMEEAQGLSEDDSLSPGQINEAINEAR